MTQRRVVITGVGLVSALGNDAPTNLAAAKAGKSGARLVTKFDASQLACRIACEVDWDSAARFGREAKKLDIFCQYGITAADEAIVDSGLDMSVEDGDRCGVITGSGIGGLHGIENQYQQMLDRGPHRISPHFVP